MEREISEQNILTLLRSWRLFSTFTAEEIENMLPMLEPKYLFVEKNEAVVLVGDREECLYLVINGRFEEQRVHGAETVHGIGLYKAGGFFGLYQIGKKKNTSPVRVVALENGELLNVQVGKVLMDSRFSERFYKALFRETKDLSVRLAYRVDVLSSKKVREKLMVYFQAMRDKHGSSTFTIKMTQNELADYLKVDRTNLSTELNRMRKEGILRIDDDMTYEILSWDVGLEKSNKHGKQQKH